MIYKKIPSIKNPNDIKSFSKKELISLCEEVRDLICETSKTNDIHFSSNLGIVELTVSIFKNFDIEKDKILYDTGHQTYVHKILTGRYKEFPNIRKDESLTGFMNMEESKYDHYSPGHSGNIISVASGMYQEFSEENKNTKNKGYINDKNIVAVIGDGAFANGLCFEALNDISYTKEPLIIILNDNDMSISKSVGSLSKTFQKMKSSPLFHFVERGFRYTLNYNKVYYWLFNTFNWFQWKIAGKNLFENLGLHYIGPIDGHNLKELDNAMIRSKWYAKQGPVLIHVKTKKGKGSDKAETDDIGDYHSITNKKLKSFGMHATDELLKLMNSHDDIRIINPAMSFASNCEIIKEKFPSRFFDPGISEEHSISKASGMSIVGMKPYVYMYSSFLQRSYDQLLHDLARLKLNCTLLIDRADLNGGDGPSHHGLYDVAFLKTMHNVLISSPRNESQLKQLINLSYDYNSSIFAIRYPKTDFLNLDINSGFQVKINEWEYLINSNAKTVVITYGPIANSFFDVINKNKLNCDLINAIFITKYNKFWLKLIFEKYKNIIVYERIYDNHGLVSDLFEYSCLNNSHVNIIPFNYKEIVGYGSTAVLDKKNRMDMDHLVNFIKSIK
ncbi:MAG: 1-deoxy-D-xylulose-5-phosphate synthase [Mycoplasma sp.]